MKPLSIRRRRVYLSFFSLIFIISIPLLILYATGYRIGDALNIVRTGGLYVSVPYSGAQVFIGETIMKETSIFQKNIFVQNLKPGSYDVRVLKDGLQAWSKRLMVFPQTVTEGYAFLFPLKLVLVEIPEFFMDGTEKIATSTMVSKKNFLRNPEYRTALLSFATTSTASTSEDVLKIKRKLSLENRGGTLYAQWKGGPDSAPHYFCVNQVCKDEIMIKTKSKVRKFDFFPGRDDLVIVALSDGLYVTEIDDRSQQNIQLLVAVPMLDFRVQSDETLLIKEDKKLYTLSI